jgi:hypothetical protein
MKKITPSEKHVIKALAWDALRQAVAIEAQTSDSDSARRDAQRWATLMDLHLENAGKALSDPDVWRRYGRE